MKPGKTGIARIVDATGYSFKGFAACWQHEAAFRQEVWLAAVLVPASFFVARSVEPVVVADLPAVSVDGH